MRPFIQPHQQAVRDLVGADGLVRGLEQLQRRMVGREARNLLLEIDIMRALVGEGACVEDRGHLADRAAHRLGPHQALEIEHAVPREIRPATIHQSGPPGRAGPVQGVAIEVQDILHDVFLVIFSEYGRENIQCNGSNSAIGSDYLIQEMP
jgi:hypothetical protein